MMKLMLTWTAVLLAGIAVISITPMIPPASGGAGVFPEWLIPVGYALSFIGAAGLFLAWVAWKRRAEKQADMRL